VSAARIVFAPDSFKGSADAADAARALAEGWAAERPDDELQLLPMADGGEGTVDAFALAFSDSTTMPVWVTGPDGNPVHSSWLRLADGTGVVELARASGITLLDPLLPFDAHTLGFGQLIAAALEFGVSRLLLGIGGSSSTDGGAGALVALGARLLDATGSEIPLGNGGLADLVSIDLSALAPLPPGGAVVLSDVTNPLLGSSGAAAVFGPQKGATDGDIALLDANLERFARVFRRLPVSDGAGVRRGLENEPGAGAAGGTGYGLLEWGASIEAGSSAIGEALGMPGAVASADLVITGEGRFDSQSSAGKVPSYLTDLGGLHDTPVALVAGLIEAPTNAFASAVSLTELAGSSKSALGDALRWLTAAGAQLARSYQPR
jgi:glycerate kinase